MEHIGSINMVFLMRTYRKKTLCLMGIYGNKLENTGKNIYKSMLLDILRIFSKKLVHMSAYVYHLVAFNSTLSFWRLRSCIFFPSKMLRSCLSWLWQKTETCRAKAHRSIISNNHQGQNSGNYYNVQKKLWDAMDFNLSRELWEL